MRNTTKKLLVLIAVVAVMVAALVVSTSAYITWDAESGTFPGGADSKYADVNSAGWVQVAGSKAVDKDGDGAYTGEGDLTQGNGYKAYFNESTGTVVLDCGYSITGSSGDYNKANLFPAWVKANVDKVTTLEIRGVSALNNAAYAIGQLKKVTTIKMDASCTSWNGTKSDTGAFSGLTSFETLLWGTWDTATGEFTKTLGEEGVVDLTNFVNLSVASTTYNQEHYMLYNGSAVRGTAAKKIILPYSAAVSATHTIGAVAISDGTFIDCNEGTSSNPNSAYNTTIANGKICTVLTNKETGATGYTTFWAINSAWSKISYLAVETEPFYGKYEGVIGYEFARDSKSLTEVVVPANVTLRLIEANAFRDTGLKIFDVKGVVAADLVIESNAFQGVSGLTVKVYSELDKANMEKALADAGYTGFTVETTRVEDDDQGGSAVVIPNVITADGFMLRTSSYNGLRALFTFSDANAEAVAAETGYTLAEYGAIAASAASYEAAGNGEALLNAANGKSIQRITIFAEDGTGLNKYVDVDTKQFCISVRDFEGENTLKDIYVAGYAIWTKGTETVVTISEYTTKTGKNTISLYTLTLEMFKAGVINSQIVPESVCMWDVLANGAVTLYDFKSIDGAVLQYNIGEAGYTYIDIPVRKLTLVGPNSWTVRGANVEDVPTTGLVWTLLYDGDNYVAVYRRDTNAAPEGVTYDYTLPTLNDKYAPFAFDAAYYQYVSAEDVTNKNLYTPVLTDGDAAKVKTLVIDAGVEKISTKALVSSSVKTVVYPDGIKVGKALFSGSGVMNFVRATADKSYLDAYAVDTLIDLSGVVGFDLNDSFNGATGAENVLLPETISLGQQTVFTNAKALTRVWSVGFDMPEAGVIDLSNTKITTICKGFFRNVDNIDTVIMPETFTKINDYSMYAENQKTDANRWYIFGDNKTETKLTIVVKSWDALNVIANTYCDAILDPTHTNGTDAMHTVDYLKITYNDVTKTVLEWRADFPAQPTETPAE